jgi:hypothetical protein
MKRTKDMRNLNEIVLRVKGFEKAAHVILAVHESSPSRIVHLENTYNQLKGLSIKQGELFRQALRCVESGLFRAAHVMAWAGFMDFFEAKLATDHVTKLKAARAKWIFASVEDLREQFAEYQLIEAGRDCGLCGKSESKALHGLLNRRNECAHPSDYFPDLNETLGFVSELLRRVGDIQGRKY